MILFRQSLLPDSAASGKIRGERQLLLLIHYWLPVALGWSVALVIKRAEGAVFSPTGLILLLAGIGAAYSFDRIGDAPDQSGPSAWLRGALLTALTLCAGTICLLTLSGKISARSLEVVAALAGISLLYRHIKRFPLVKTVAVAFCWTWACATLPFGKEGLCWLTLDVTPPLILMISAGCILCDLKDIHEDRREQVPSLPALLGIRPTCLIATGLALLASLSTFLHHHYGLTAGALLLAGAAQFPSFLSMKPTGPILIDSILILPGVLIATGIV